MILTSTARAALLAADDQTDNPVMLGVNLIDSIASSNGVAADGAAANAISGATFDFALPSVVSGAADLEFTVTGALDGVGVAAHNLGTLGATVALEYSDDSGVSWHDAGAGAASPEDDQAILFRFHWQAHDDWRLSITGVASGQPAVGVLVAGREIVSPRRLYQGYTPPITPTNVTLQSNVSEGGHLLGAAAVRAGSQTSVELNHLPPAFLRGSAWRAFQAHFNAGGGFFWAWRPRKYGDCFFAWRAGGVLVPTNSGPLDLMSVQMALRLYDDA